MCEKNTIVAATALTIEKYQMIPDRRRPVPVAFSGGKDSLTTILVLRELGYDVRPVIANRGDDPAFQPGQIAEALKIRKGLDADVLHLRNQDSLPGIKNSEAEQIKTCLHRVDNLGPNESMCTPCYNARTTALIAYTRSCGAEVFVIGQHLTDMLTTLMKCYWTEKYFLAFTKPQGIAYDGYKMAGFIAELKQKYTLCPLCPEQLGGMPTPRVACRLEKSRIIGKDGKDYTKPYQQGSSIVLSFAKMAGIKRAYMKKGSPSCGVGGITRKMLEEAGIQVHLL